MAQDAKRDQKQAAARDAESQKPQGGETDVSEDGTSGEKQPGERRGKPVKDSRA